MTEIPSYEELLVKIQFLERSAPDPEQTRQTAMDGFVFADTTGKFLEVNNAFCEMTGYSEDELLTMRIQDLEAEENDKEAAGRIRKIVEKGEDRFETRHRRKDGAVFDVEVSAQCKKGANEGLVCFLRDVTERKLAEKALAESEERFRLAFHTSPDAINLNRLEDGMYVDINDGFAQIMGYAREEVVGRTSIELNTWKNPRDRDRLVQGLREKGYVGNLEAQFVAKDGSVKDGLMSARVLKINDENLIISITRDITPYKRAENALRLKAEQHKSILRTAMDGFWMAETTGKILEVNEAYCQTSGYSQEELLKMNIRELEADESDSDVAMHAERIVALGQDRFESRHRRKDGTILDMEACVQYRPEDGGRFVCFIKDITERKTSEEALRNSERKWRNILVNTPQIGISLDPEGNIVFANHYFLKLTGWEEHEVIGRNWFDMFIPEHARREMREIFSMVVHHKQTLDFSTHENEILLKNGEHRNVAWSNALTKDGSGNITDATCLGIDLTERKDWETRLLQAQKMESIGNLAGGIAHDFNNILCPIIGLAEMLAADLPPNSLQKENVDEILKAGRRGSALVKQILAFSRRNDHESVPIRMQFVMKEVLKLGRASIPTNIQIDQYLQPDCGLVLADSTQLHQIGMNLVTNAYHAVENVVGGKIEVEVRQVDIKHGVEPSPDSPPPGKYAVLSVSDNGIGIPKENLDKIFEPYFTTKERGKGTGLGLSAVYGIAKEYKGEIKVASEPGKGATFQIYLPLMAASVFPESNPKPSVLKTGTERILLVDDEVAIANLLQQMLERLGYTAFKRTSSEDALEAFKATPNAYDLVVTDMAMPNMTGDQLAVKLKAVRPDIPIVICTGFSERIDENKAKTLGIKGFLMKPILMSELSETVRKALDKAQPL